MSAGDSGLLDPTLLSLFLEEVGGNLRILNEGLVAVEDQPDDLRRIEPLMRAAHSVKGAMRIAGLDQAVQVAHSLEECLVLAQHARLTLRSADLDVLLAAVDTLGRLAAALGPEPPPATAEDADQTARLLEQLRALAQGTHAVASPLPGVPGRGEKKNQPRNSRRMMRNRARRCWTCSATS